MKKALLFSILGVIGAVNLSAIPSFSQTTPVSLSGGSFSATNSSTTGVTSFNGGTALTSLGTIVFSNVTGGALTIPTIGFNSTSPTPPSRLPIAGDSVNVVNGISSGTLSGQSFTNALLNSTGAVQTFSQSGANNTITGSITSGTIQLPSPLVSSLSGTGTTGTTRTTGASGTGTAGSIFGNSNTSGIFGSTVGSSSAVTASQTQIVRNIFGLQPVADVEQYFLPPSGLAGSRIHPDLFAK